MPPSENTTTQPAQLHYTLTSDDLLDGFVARHRNVRRPWYLRRLNALLVTGVISVAFVSSVPFEDVSAGVAVAMAVVLAVLLIFGLGFSLLLRRLVGPRLLYRLPVWQLMRANPTLSQPIQATLSETGAHLSGPHGETSWTWSQFPLYAETDRSFVLLASQRTAAAVLVLPKRGLAGADPAPVRELLSAYTSQVR